MKKFNLNELTLEELSTEEKMNVNGGGWFGALLRILAPKVNMGDYYIAHDRVV